MVIIKELSNKIRVVCEEMPYLRSVSFGVWIKVGSVNENKDNNGISHMIEHMLFKGTSNRSAKNIADEMAQIGGNINAFTSKECTSFYTRTLDEHLEQAIDIISDMINNSIINEAELIKEKGVIMEEIDMYEDSPEDLVHEMLQKSIWSKHPLGYVISGNKNNVKNFSREEIFSYIQKYYVAENIVISIAGNFKEDKVMDILEERFGQVQNTKIKSISTTPIYYPSFYTKKKDIEQIHLNMAFDSISYHDEDKYVLSIVNTILGGSINSRLFMEIREELGLTYSIYSYGNSYKKAGLFHIYAAMNPTQTEVVLNKIWEVIEDFKAKAVSLQELGQTKEQIKTELIIGSESTQSRMNTNGKSILFRNKIIAIDETIRRLNEVTTEDVERFLNKYFNRSAYSLSLVGNLDEIPLERIQQEWKASLQ